jgi:hypothetical protein
MTEKYGVTTISRWLTEELPRGVKCYIEHRGVMLELIGVRGRNGVLTPELRPTGRGRQFSTFVPVWITVELSTQVVLSLGEELSGKSWDRISQQLRPVAPDCWALKRYLTEATNGEATVNTDNYLDSSVYCG